jgi:hypothetical protein
MTATSSTPCSISPPVKRRRTRRSAKIIRAKVKSLFNIFAIIVLSALVLTACERNNEKVRKKVKALVGSVTPRVILEGAAELDQKSTGKEGMPIPLDTLPASFSVFEPLEVLCQSKGSYLIVTDRWVQHRTGLFVAAPDEIVPASTERLVCEKLGDRLYFYQD